MQVMQTTSGKTAQITETVIRLETLRDSLPAATISDYSAKQRLLEAMDIKLRRDVKPHSTSHTSFEQLVEIADKRKAIAHSTRVYGNQNHHSNATSNAVTQAMPKRPQN